MGAAVILGSWRLRHDEPGPAEAAVVEEGLEVPLDIEAAVVLAEDAVDEVGPGEVEAVLGDGV